MGAEKRQQKGALELIVALVAVLALGILFVGAVSGWFNDPKVTLDANYHGDFTGFTDLPVDTYENLIRAKESFIVFVDQDDCKTADRLREYISAWATEAQVQVYKMMFEEAKTSSLHDSVKYYPSIAIISKGKVVAWLKADSDADAPAYNDQTAFRDWLSQYL